MTQNLDVKYSLVVVIMLSNLDKLAPLCIYRTESHVQTGSKLTCIKKLPARIFQNYVKSCKFAWILRF